MRVLFLAPLPDPITGQSVACQALLSELRKQSDVAVVDLGKGSFQQGLSSLARVLKVLKIIARVGRVQRAVDLIYLTISQSRAGNFRDLLIYALCFGRLQRMVIHLHGGAGLRLLFAPSARLTRGLNRFFLRRLGGVVVEGERQVHIFDGLAERGRIHVIRNFAQDELFTTEKAITEKFRRPRPLRLLFLSNLLPGKGHLELVDAYASLDEPRRAAIEIDFAGGFESPRDREDFLHKIESLSSVRYHGTVLGERKRRMFAEAHVFCLPTYYPYEGQPLSILEAYASGCAVVTTDHSGIFDTFAPGVNGVVVEKRSVTSLANALAMIADDPESMRDIAIANLRIARQEYRTADYTENVSRLLAAVAKG